LRFNGRWGVSTFFGLLGKQLVLTPLWRSLQSEHYNQSCSHMSQSLYP
jgi:hypothetical protein